MVGSRGSRSNIPITMATKRCISMRANHLPGHWYLPPPNPTKPSRNWFFSRSQSSQRSYKERERERERLKVMSRLCVNILEARDAKYTMTEFSEYRVKCLWLWKFLFVSMAPVGGKHEQVPGWYYKTLKERKTSRQ